MSIFVLLHFSFFLNPVFLPLYLPYSFHCFSSLSLSLFPFFSHSLTHSLTLHSSLSLHLMHSLIPYNFLSLSLASLPLSYMYLYFSLSLDTPTLSWATHLHPPLPSSLRPHPRRTGKTFRITKNMHLFSVDGKWAVKYSEL